MKFNKIVFSVGLLIAAHCSVIGAMDGVVDPLQAQISLHRALNWRAKGCAVGVANALNDGADPNRRLQAGFPQGPPLYVAASRGNKEIVEILLGHGAVVNGCSYRERTPLHGAVFLYSTPEGIEQRLAIMQLLLDRDANVNAQEGYGQEPLHAVVEKWGDRGLGAVYLLLTVGADVNASYVNNDLLEEKMFRIFCGSSRTKKEIDEIYQNKLCTTSLSLAAQKRCKNIVRVLRGAGADTSLIKSDATRAFVKKVEDDERARVQTLLALGFDFSESTKENVRKTAPVLSGSNKPLPDDLLKVVVDYTSDDLSKRWRIEHNASENKN